MGTNARNKGLNTIAILTTRRRTSLALLLALVALSISCKRRLIPVHRHTSPVASQRTGASPKIDASKPITVSILELLSNPKRYYGTRIVLKGYLEVYELHYEMQTNGVLRVGHEGAPWPWNNEINLRFAACNSKAQLGNKFISRDQAKVHSLRFVELVGQFQNARHWERRRPDGICSIERIIDLPEPNPTVPERPPAEQHEPDSGLR